MLAAAWCGETEHPFVTVLAGVTRAVADYLAQLSSHVASLAAPLAGARQIYFAGRGASLASAQCAGLITKESVRFAAEGISSAAFRHGPLEMAGPEVFVLVFEGTGPSSALNRGLVEDVVRAAASRTRPRSP